MKYLRPLNVKYWKWNESALMTGLNASISKERSIPESETNCKMKVVTSSTAFRFISSRIRVPALGSRAVVSPFPARVLLSVLQPMFLKRWFKYVLETSNLEICFCCFDDLVCASCRRHPIIHASSPEKILILQASTPEKNKDIQYSKHPAQRNIKNQASSPEKNNPSFQPR